MEYPFFTKGDSDYFEITCRDLPALTAIAYCKEDIEKEAIEALQTTFMIYMANREKIPLPSKKQDGEVVFNLDFRSSLKVALYNEALSQKVTKSEMAKRMGLTPKQVDRIWDVNHPTKFETIEQAFFVLNKKIVHKILSI